MGKLCLALALPAFLRVIGFVVEPLLDDAEIHRTIGEPARIRRHVPDPAQLSVVTWNIERGKEYDAIVRVLKALDADVVLLQEVDRECRRTGYRNVARDLAHALDMNWVSGGEFQEIGEGRRGRAAITGQAVLSKQPIDGVEVLRFKAQARLKWSINPAQPRRGGRMTLKARTAGVRFYNTHIESGGNDSLQRTQISLGRPAISRMIIIGSSALRSPTSPASASCSAAEGSSGSRTSSRCPFRICVRVERNFCPSFPLLEPRISLRSVSVCAAIVVLSSIRRNLGASAYAPFSQRARSQ